MKRVTNGAVRIIPGGRILGVRGIGIWPEAVAQTAADQMDKWLMWVFFEKLGEVVNVNRGGCFEEVGTSGNGAKSCEVK